MSNITDALKHIIILGKQICEKDEWCHMKCAEPHTMAEILAHEAKLGIKIPDAVKEILTVSDEIYIDGCGLMHFYGLKNCSLQGTGEGAYIPKYLTIGSVIGAKGGSIYADLNTGILSVKVEPFVYEPVRDLCKDILEPYEKRLKKYLSALERKDELLEKQKDNPFREYYDTLVSYNKRESGSDSIYPPVTIYPPASEEDISSWEKENNVVLPESYKNWVLLSNGTFFNGWDVYSLDDIDLEEMTEEYDGEKYICLASLTGCCDFLLGGVETGKAVELSEDFEVDDGEDSLMFHLENMIEWYEEDLEE